MPLGAMPSVDPASVQRRKVVSRIQAAICGRRRSVKQMSGAVFSQDPAFLSARTMCTRRENQ
jgi:hypothetical protein